MKILVATDGSRGSTAALSFAARLAKNDAGELIVLTVDPGNGIPPEAMGPAPGKRDPALVRPEARRALDAAAREIKRHHARAQFQLVTARRRDEIPEAIAREADRIKADLVVVGSEGRDTLNEWVVGGVALRLIYVARRPVTVVRPPRRRKAV
jgi:nucleotide-binding universal stress UspA family protein